MEHASYLVDLLNTSGRIVGQKTRRSIDKSRDIYHAVHVMLITPKGELVLGSIPAREDLPNLYTRKLGSTIATIRRSNETAEQAAVRALTRELFIGDGEVQFVGEAMFQLPERPTYISLFYIVADPPQAFSIIDIETLAVVTPQQLRNIIERNPHEIAPTLQAIWQAYESKLPI